MKNYRYSKKTNLFYPVDIDYADLPDDCIEVSEQAYQLAIIARSENKPFEFDDDVLIIYDAAPDGFHFFDWTKKIWILDKTLKQESITVQNTDQKAILKADAEERITLLERKRNIKRASTDDLAMLDLLYGFTIDLDELDLTKENIEWPIKPE